MQNVILIHGILASGRNLSSFAKALSSKFPHWHIDSPDLPQDKPRTLQECAWYLAEMYRENPPDILIGHSFGGKVALALSEIIPVKQVWVLDSPAGAVSLESSETLHVISVLEQVTMPIPSRKILVETLLQRGLSRSIALWMTTNLRESVEGLVWSFDLKSVRKMLESYANTSFEVMLRKPHPQTEYHFVRAEHGRGFSLDLSPQVFLHDLKRAGHWVHVDNLADLIEIIVKNTLLF